MDELIATADGSPSLRRNGLAFHSQWGALGESQWVFVQASALAERLKLCREEQRPLRVLEVGMGTGLNALLAAQEAQKMAADLEYRGWEPLPPDPGLLQHYYQQLPNLAPLAPLLGNVYALGQARQGGVWLVHQPEPWPIAAPTNWADVLFYDPFGPRDAPEMWAEPALQAAASALAPGGCLVTYSITGHARRCLAQAGLQVEALKGFGRKKEMMRASRILGTKLE